MRTHRIIAILVSLLLSLAVAEGALRLLEKFQLGDRAIEGKLIDDPILGQKLAPYTQGHDANGFRNASVPRQADIITLGDSQTWGVNAKREDSWPQQLSRISGHNVYNMALGGFGPVQYHVLTSEALSLSPKLIIVAVYLGNDIYDAYSMVYQHENYRNLRDVKAPKDFTVDTVGPRAGSFWNQEKEFHANFGRGTVSGLSFWLREHLAIGRLLNRTGLWPGSADVDFEIDRHWALNQPNHGIICENPAIKTVFTTAYRLEGLNLDEPRIAEGLRITKNLIGDMKRQADASKVRLLILLIPTKESAYAGVMSEKKDSNPTYGKLIEMEGRVRKEIVEECRTQNIDCLDTLAYLSQALGRGEAIYPTSTESHPNPRGYSVIASAVNNNLGKLDF
jgi:lysophospholipase L1-like esterase